MSPTFGVSAYWYRQEFAKSRGMVHWHGLCWRSDREPHNLLHNAIQWESMKPGKPRKNLWPPLEDSAALPSEEQNPIIKLVMDVSMSKETLLEDYVLLTNRFNIHLCSDYCLKKAKTGRESL